MYLFISKEETVNKRQSLHNYVEMCDRQDNQQIFRLTQGKDTLEIGNCASSQILGGSCLLLARLSDEVLPPIRWRNLSKFSKLMASPSSGYKRHKLTRSSIHYMYCMHVDPRGFHTWSLEWIPADRSYSNRTFGVAKIQIHAHSTTDITHVLCTSIESMQACNSSSSPRFERSVCHC